MTAIAMILPLVALMYACYSNGYVDGVRFVNEQKLGSEQWQKTMKERVEAMRAEYKW